jgi:glycerophosphoryl diester phosphodiesterase
MTKIVGHRGVKGLELENTIKGFKLAKQLGVDAVEFDVLSTKDGKIVVCHDDNLLVLSKQSLYVSQLTYGELAEIKLVNGESVPLLYDVLSLMDGIPIILDIKTNRFIPEICKIIDKFPKANISLTTDAKFINRVVEAKRLRPHIPVLAPRHYSPIGLIRTTRKYGVEGLNIRYFWLNPLTYFYARRKGLKIQVYTVDNILVSRMIRKFYPGVLICTNHPELLLADQFSSSPS